MTETKTRTARIRRATRTQLLAVVKMIELSIDGSPDADEPLYDEAVRVVSAELRAIAEKRS